MGKFDARQLHALAELKQALESDGGL
jgi:hypothetical protein